MPVGFGVGYLQSPCFELLSGSYRIRGEKSGGLLIIDLENITVDFGRQRVLDGVSVQFAGGSMGLLGPNGAGKSTLLKTLLGFIKPVTGGGKVLGLDVLSEQLAIRQRVGYMPENDCHIPGMNAVSFVAFTGQLTGMKAKEEWLSRRTYWKRQSRLSPRRTFRVSASW